MHFDFHGEPVRGEVGEVLGFGPELEQMNTATSGRDDGRITDKTNVAHLAAGLTDVEALVGPGDLFSDGRRLVRLLFHGSSEPLGFHDVQIGPRAGHVDVVIRLGETAYGAGQPVMVDVRQLPMGHER